MVHKIEAACKLVDLEFCGWATMPQFDEVTIRLQKGTVKKDVTLSIQTMNVLDMESVSLQLKALFVGASECS